MKRGEIWTVSTGGVAGKPHPAVIVQDDRFGALDTVTVCVFTTDPFDTPIFRLQIDPTKENGLRAPSRLMADKLSTVPKEKMGARIGWLGDQDMERLKRAILVFLGLT